MKNIRELLEPLVAERFRQDEKYREGHIRIINPLPGRAIMGVHIPEMRRLAKDLASGDAAERIIGSFENEAVKGRQALSYEEMMVWGMMINSLRPGLCGTGEDARLRMLRNFVPYIDNWAVCDSFSCGTGWLVKTDCA